MSVSKNRVTKNCLKNKINCEGFRSINCSGSPCKNKNADFKAISIDSIPIDGWKIKKDSEINDIKLDINLIKN